MRWLPSQRQMETFESGTFGSGGKFVHFFFLFLFLVILYSVWLIEQNHYLQLFLHLGYKVVCASQRASWAIAAETRGLKCCQLCQSDDWNQATSLDNVWLNVWSAVIEYLVNLSFLVACTGHFFSLCGICCHYLFMCFRRNPTARAFVPALSDLLRGPYSGRSWSITDLSAPGTGVYLTARLDEWKADICHDLTDIKIPE